MAKPKTGIQFSQSTLGVHHISNINGVKIIDEVEIDVNKLDIADIRTVINGLANIMSSLSTVMYKFEKPIR